MASTEHHPIIVAGTGPAGLVAAIALADAGHDIALAGPAPHNEDARTTALMLPALAMLERIGVLPALREKAAPLRTMRIVDGTRRLLRSPTVTFRAGEIGEDCFGLNIPNSALNAALVDAVRSRASIRWHESLVADWRLETDEAVAVLEDGTQIHARLAVAADGRLSPARAAAGIATHSRAYPQSALVLSFGHSRQHGFTSTEFHTETGPCTQVPLPGQRSSLVWVLDPKEARDLADTSDEDLSARLERRMESILGAVTVEPGRQIYPLSTALPARFAANRVALVGEAAHVFPPIGAQGLNLGLRDVQDLVSVAASNRADPGNDGALRAYDRKRRPDIMARSGAVNLLNRSLLSSLIPAQLARSAGLGIVAGFGPLRALFMREGMRPGSGLVSLAGDLREKVGRQ